MKFLVTGGAGFIGTNLIKRLFDDGHKIISLDNYSTGKKENELIVPSGPYYLDVDISQVKDYDYFSDKEVNYVMHDVSGIFHIAALPRIQPSFETPSESFEANVQGTQNIMDWARKNGTPVVYAGSSSVHGDKYANPYTFTKWLGEEVVNMYSKIYNVPTSICRFYNVYGEHQATEGAYCNVLGIFQRLHNEGKPLTITGDGEQRRDFTYVGDIVDGLVRCMQAMHGVVDMRFEGEVFELGRGKNYSINEIAEAFTPDGWDALTHGLNEGESYPTEYIDAWKGEARNTLNTDTKARDVLDWKPKMDVLDYIRENYAR